VLNLEHLCIADVIGIGPSLDSPELMFGFKVMANVSLRNIFEQISSERRPAFWTHEVIAMTALRIVLGMRYIHRKGMVHGALHPGNILFDDDNQAHISDIMRPDYRIDISLEINHILHQSCFEMTWQKRYGKLTCIVSD
jgi:serine/threonine protein kinase